MSRVKHQVLFDLIQKRKKELSAFEKAYAEELEILEQEAIRYGRISLSDVPVIPTPNLPSPRIIEHL
ncbi:hypothetical protein L4C54_23140 [Vibrio lamellibrachiae]|uniref:hypothetical protein n=1 Tax=Vibrio lamellibrachiae TaxID=2910253 RepID=UPI003D0E52C8